MPPLVLVTEPEFRRCESAFASPSALQCVVAPSEESALADMVRRLGVRGVVVGSQPYRGDLYDALADGGIVARFGVGYDNIDLARATSAGVYCTNTPGVLDQSVAEHTMLLIAAAARHLPGLSRAMQDGEWGPRQGTELSGCTVAVIGAGRIGRALARIARFGFGMRVVGCRRSAVAPFARVATLEEPFDGITHDFAAAVRDADFVSVHMPATPENRHAIGASRLAEMRTDAWLINTARGIVVDEAALFDALKAHRIAGAALDVFEREPYVPADEARDLRTLENVILTPHVGSHTAAANRGMAERALGNVRLMYAGESSGLDLINPAVRDRVV